jgi:hypothetical protein
VRPLPPDLVADQPLLLLWSQSVELCPHLRAQVAASRSADGSLCVSPAVERW